jgi:hypothetical protein
MGSYLDLNGFKSASVMPDEDVEALVGRYPAFLSTQLELQSAWIDGRLRKRYAAPFAEPYPKLVELWLAAIVTELAYIKRGVDANDEQWPTITDSAKQAKDEIAEAADGELGRFDLPLRADTTATGISKGATRTYSEQSPYVGFDRQRTIGRTEDGSGRGTGG